MDTLALPFCEIRISVPRPSYPYRWKCTQVVPTETSTIGDKLKKVRLQRHLFQADVARHLGVDPATIHNWECKIYPPAKRYMSRIENWITKPSTENKI
jgi:DNA-binding XRE family transcriptional regulator